MINLYYAVYRLQGMTVKSESHFGYTQLNTSKAISALEYVKGAFLTHEEAEEWLSENGSKNNTYTIIAEYHVK